MVASEFLGSSLKYCLVNLLRMCAANPLSVLAIKLSIWMMGMMGSPPYGHNNNDASPLSGIRVLPCMHALKMHALKTLTEFCCNVGCCSYAQSTDMHMQPHAAQTQLRLGCLQMKMSTMVRSSPYITSYYSAVSRTNTHTHTHTT